MLYQIEQQLRPIFAVIFVKQRTARAFTAEPNTVAIEHAPQAGKRQAVIPKRLAVTSSNHVNRMRSAGDDFLHALRRLGFPDWRKARQTPAPKMHSRDWTNGFEFLPLLVNLVQFDPLSQLVAQEHVSLSRRFQARTLDDHRESFDEWSLRALAHAIEPAHRGGEQRIDVPRVPRRAVGPNCKPLRRPPLRDTPVPARL